MFKQMCEWSRCMNGLYFLFFVVVVFVQTSAQKARLHAVLHHRHCPQVSRRRSVSATCISVDSLSLSFIFSLHVCVSLFLCLPFSLSSPFSLRPLPCFLAPPLPPPHPSPLLSPSFSLSYFCRLSLTLSLSFSHSMCLSF